MNLLRCRWTYMLAALAILTAASWAPAAHADYRDEVLADSPAGYWRLGELSGPTALDQMGANNGSYAGGVQFNQPGGLPGDPNGAAKLDGITGRVVVPDSNSLDASTGATIELWVKRTKSAQYQVIAGKPGNGLSRMENYALWFNTSNRIQAYFGNGTTFVTVSTGVIDTNWHHVAATYDNATARIYVDGVQAASANSTVALTPNALPLNLGRTNDGQYFFGGTLDEVAMYRSALSAARIQVHFSKAAQDLTAPVVSLAQPAGGSHTSDSTPALSGVAGLASGDSATVTVRIFAGSTATGLPVQSPTATRAPNGAFSVDAAELADGVYTARAEQADAAGNVGFSGAATFTVDTVGPAASIGSAPPSPSNSAAAQLEFSAGEPGGSFECSLDAGAYTACTSPRSYSGLADGSHEFAVRAIDLAGNTGAPATTSWIVDTLAPSTVIDSGPPPHTTSASADFAFSADEPGSTFDCALDGAAYAPCSSPQSLSSLAEGSHTFAVRATDAAGNTGSAASRSWTVDTTAPVVSLLEPAQGSSTNDPTPAFSGVAGLASGDSGSVTVRVYAGAAAEGDPIEVLSASRQAGGSYSVDAAALQEGTYTARAEQADAAGNTGLSEAQTFTVDFSVADTTPPHVTLLAPADNSVGNVATPTFSGVAGTNDGDLAQVTVNVYAGSSAGGDPVQSLTATPQPDGSYAVDAATLADGTYTARSEQADAAGNTGMSAAHTFTVDTVAPVASITSGPTGTVGSASAVLGFIADEGGSSFECKLDGGAYAPCSSPASLSGLADGDHEFRVRASDAAANTGPAASRTWTVDTTAPAPTITTPAAGASVDIPTPHVTGTAGTAAGDSATVTIRLYAGPTATGVPVQILTATRQAGGAYSVDPTPLGEGTFTARAEQGDATGNVGMSAARTFQRKDPVMIGAGDISSCEASDGDDETAALLAQNPEATVFALGDNAYSNGQPSDYANCYGATWGAHKARTRPVPGGHDLATVSGGATPGQGYLDYFQNQLAPYGPTATNRLKLYYSYDIGTWHVVALNAGCYFDYAGCDAAAMEQWMRDDLANHQNQCTMAMWHDARWSSGSIHGNTSFAQGMWKIAYDNGVDVVLNGHEHDYERFAPQDSDGNLDPEHGIREFVVGTGGYFHYALGTRQPNSEVVNSDTYGVLRLKLHPSSYDFEFLPEAGRTFTDSGSANCHDAPTAPAGTPTVRSTASNTANHPSTTLAIAKPPGTAYGDVLVAAVAHQGGSIRNMTAPAGWTVLPSTDFFESTNVRLHGWYKQAGAVEPASYTFTLTGGSGMALGGGIAAITGADPVSPINASGGQSNGSGMTLTLTAPSINTTSANTLLLYAGAVNAPVNFTAPQLMTELWDVKTSGQYNLATETAVVGVAAAGPTGTRTATLSAKAKGVAFVGAIRPPQ